MESGRRQAILADLARRRADLSPAKRALLEAWAGGRAVVGDGRLGPRPADEPAVLSFQQQRHWFLEQLEPGAAVQHIAACFRLTGPLDLAALEASVDRLVARHEILRTGLVAEGGRPAPRIAAHLSLGVPLVDLQARPTAEREAEALRQAAHWVAQPFDLAEPPLCRYLLVRLGPDHHVLLVWMHHAVGDGWSLGVAQGELAALYAALVAGREPRLPELPLQYSDFAHWQRRRLQGEARERLLTYWRGQLGGELPALELPTDHPRPARQTYRGSSHRFRLRPELVAALRRLCRAEDASLFMGLLAAFQTLLHRFSGQDDVLVGTPVAGRDRPELEPLIGPFINILVLRTDLGDDPSFRALLGRVREVALGAYAQQELPFEALVEALQPRRDLGRTPLFQAMFILRNYPTPSLELPGLTVEPLAVEKRTSEFDLTLLVDEAGGALEATLEYSTDLFEASTIARLADAFERLLRELVADPDRPISRPDLLDPLERYRLLVEWNRTAADYPRERCTHDLVAEQADRRPDAVALVCGPERLSYRELELRAARVADELRRRGVGPGVAVGLGLERSPWLVAGLLGVLKAGGALVPFDPGGPPVRNRAMLEEAGVRLVLVDEAGDGGGRSIPPEAAVLRLGEAFRPGDRPVAQPGRPPVGPRDLAYVIYTSGSTGRPKGVEVEHRALTNFLWAMRRRPGLSAEDVLLAITPLTFDIALLELLLPLLVGGRVVLADRATATDPRRLAGAIAEHGVTVLQATPVTWRLLLDGGWAGAPGLTALCGGEHLPGELAERLLGRVGRLWNLYGPTETTVWSIAGEVTGGSGSPPVGRPIANTRVYVLDTHLRPVPVGVPGELYIGGKGLARGYRGRPDLTAERFIPDPFGAEPGARLYRTGDRARYCSDGSLEVLGRLDDQLKLHGHRIEPGEVEAALREHAGLRDAAVAVREATPGDPRLVAYVVPGGAAIPEPAELRGFLKARLPAAMVPATFVVLEALPLTPNGKLDRRSLPAPSDAHPAPGKGFVAPRTPLEGQLAAICAEVLELDRVGVRDNFFDLGGASFQVLEIVARAERAGLPLTVEHLFVHQTIAELAEVLQLTDPRLG